MPIMNIVLLSLTDGGSCGYLSLQSLTQLDDLRTLSVRFCEL